MILKWKNLFCVVLCLVSLVCPCSPVMAEVNEDHLSLSVSAYVLMEPETGTVIAEKDRDTRRCPASVTKIMTLLLIYDHMAEGKIKPEDMVTTSAYAKSMGGSQVFLEEGETQSVETMIKCIVIASGNDASVAMAEHIAGSEPEFVKRMNTRAQELGMKHTHFVDCCGLTDSDEHYTTPYDIALMSRELINKYPQILEYSSVWMDTITHTTKQGTKEFGLSNTNRLIRSYKGCVGLKTGSTSKAGFCLSAVAKRNGIRLIAVVMAAPDSKTRVRETAALLDYGFSRCSLYEDTDPGKLPELTVKRGVRKQVPLVYEGSFRYLSTDGTVVESPEKKLAVPEEVEAPVKKGQKAGELIYCSQNGKELGRVAVLYGENVKKASYLDCLKSTAGEFCF